MFRKMGLKRVNKYIEIILFQNVILSEILDQGVSFKST